MQFQSQSPPAPKPIPVPGRLQRQFWQCPDLSSFGAQIVLNPQRVASQRWQISKTCSFGNLTQNAAGRYRPAEVVKAEKTILAGMPDVNLISASHLEKQNHTLRMHCRRLTRLTNVFSKKLENFQAAVAPNFAYHDFCKTHGTRTARFA